MKLARLLGWSRAVAKRGWRLLGLCYLVVVVVAWWLLMALGHLSWLEAGGVIGFVNLPIALSVGPRRNGSTA